MRPKYLLCLLCLHGLTAAAQVKDTVKIDILPGTTTELTEYVLAANKFRENKRNIVQQIQVIPKKEIEWIMPQTTAVLLEQTGNIFVQKSQLGGGSPVLRGFEASRVLLVVDGVRMNNAIYRAGHLQNVITVDNNILDNVEVLYGPASTLYGSDALGGAIIFTSKMPELSSGAKASIGANAMFRYSSAYNEQTGHVDFNIGLKKLAFLTSVTYSKFGDLRQGSFRNPFYDGFGERNEYIERRNGGDSIIANDDPNIQKQSGYSQVDIMEKILFRQNDRVSHILNLQYSTSSDIPRYDRLTDRRNGQLRFAEWYYGPQDRLMASYQLNATRVGWFDELKVGLNYQAIEESRYQRNRDDNGLQGRVEKVGVLGYNIDARKFFGRNELTFGIDGQSNKVTSTASERDIVTGQESPLDTRYPDGGSNMFYTAVYAQHILKIIPDKLVLNDGLRLNYVSATAKFNDKTFYPFPFDEATQNHIAWSGNLGLAYMPCRNWRITLGGSTGFRSPNIDDIGKVFETAAGEQLVVPNPDVTPEYTYNADLGISYNVPNRLRLEATGFYTWFRDAIVLDRFTLNGSDSAVYDGQTTAVVAYQNKAKAYLYGFNAAITATLAPSVTLYSTVNFTYGRYQDQNDQEVPLDHVPPVYGKTSIRYQPGRLSTEFFALYNGWKRIQDYNPFGEDNQQYATAFGMPGWYTLNIRAGYKVHRYFSAELALENLLDYNYRPFASGISGAGRNFVVTLRGHF